MSQKLINSFKPVGCFICFLSLIQKPNKFDWVFVLKQLKSCPCAKMPFFIIAQIIDSLLKCAKMEISFFAQAKEGDKIDG